MIGAFLAPLPIWWVDLSISDGGFVSGGATGQWEWAVPTVGPLGYGATWCTNCDGPYLHDTVDWLEIAMPDLTDVAEPSLVLHHWYAIRSGDSAVVQVDDGSGFVTVDPAYGYPDAAGFVGESATFLPSVFDLTPFGASPVVRLVLTADAAQSDDGWYLSEVDLFDGDVVAPLVTVDTPPVDTQDLVGPYPVPADVVDDRQVQDVSLWYSAGGAPAVAVAVTGPPYVGLIPAQPADTEVGWWIEASDGLNVGRFPLAGQSTFRVHLAAPTDLHPTDDGRGVADAVDLLWTPPDSPHPVDEYRVYREGTVIPVALSPNPWATVPLQADQPQEFYVVAEYDVGVGDPSEHVQLDYEVPTLDPVDPSTGYQGEELYLEVAGQSLYLLQGQSTVDLGPDVEVLGLDVRDVARAVAHVRVADDAAIGPVDLAIDGPPGRYVFHEAFDVRDGADAPSIEDLTPAAIGQGEEATLTLTATIPFAAVPTVGTDEDLLVTGPVEREGRVVTVPVAASTRARVGLHTLTLADGQRLFTAGLQVDERLSHLQNGCCSTSPPPTRGWLMLAGLVPAWRARRRGPPRSSR